MTTTPVEKDVPCIDGGTKHAWEKRGLDIHTTKAGVEKLVAIRRCVWCGKERYLTPKHPRTYRKLQAEVKAAKACETTD